MSTTTTNFGLVKPELTDPADITQTNENWDKIDAELLKNDKIFIAEFPQNGYDEIVEAANSGKMVFYKHELSPSTPHYVPLIWFNEKECYFASYLPSKYIQITVPSTGSSFTNVTLNPSNFTYGTEDLTAGVSALITGKLHFVYE